MDYAQALGRATIFQECSQLAESLGAVNLAQGVPEALMDEEINALLLTAQGTGWQYTNSWGLNSLRKAVASLYAPADWETNVLITSGCTESLFVGLHALQGDYGDRIGFIEPFYPYYPGIAQMAGLKPAPIRMRRCSGTTAPDWDELETLFQQGLQLLLLNSPHNPTGWTLSEAEALHLRALLDRYGVFLAIDDAYRHFVYDMAFANATRHLIINNESCFIAGAATKLLSASGFRIGWLLAQPTILGRAHTIHLYTSYCQPAPLQQVAAQLLRLLPQLLPSMTERYRLKRDRLHEALCRTGLVCELPPGGHFLFADYESLEPQMPPNAFANAFASRYGIVALPSTPFYLHEQPQKLRFSFAVAPAVVDQALSCLC